MTKEDLQREPRIGGFCFGIAFIIFLGQAGTEVRGSPDAPQGAEERLVLDSSSAAKAVKPLIDRLWDSGFFRRNAAVHREILNNSYVFFKGESERAAKEIGILGYFWRRPVEGDRIFLRKDLFARFTFRAFSDPELSGPQLEKRRVHEPDRPTGRPPVDLPVRRPDLAGQNTRDAGLPVLPILVYELCHDLWAHVLDGAERAAFDRDAEALVSDYGMAVTPEDRALFLLRAGDDMSGPDRFETFAGLRRVLASGVISSIYGEEVFAWLAERLFRMKGKIPRPMRRYYAGIIAGIEPVP